MNDGGGENVEDSGKKKKSGVNAFSQAIARIVIAQICESVGFQGFQHSALDALSDVAVRYVREVGKTADLYANLAGRSQGNVFDVIQGLEDLGSVQGFSGASDVNRCLFSSGTIRELIRHVNEAEENPFAYSIPGFPVVKDVKRNPSFVQAGESPPEHVPSWLPVFPDSESYSNLNSAEKKDSDCRNSKVEQVEELRNADKPLVPGSGLGASVAISQENPSKAKRVIQCNPFLAPPLHFGEKEVSQVSVPVRLSDEALVQPQNHAAMENQACMLETFAPANEAVKATPVDIEDGRNNILLNTKSPLQFRLRRSGKPLGKAVGLLDKDHEDFASPLCGENGKDDKKRRAEQILKESESDMQDLPHL
ncbi:transcription initiation factor TFIID subunit 8-like [Nicotiana tomentosiformis]|uniref:transcription initiation factor TFIID subunit 8-like n=1 Tax=Nicotiana tomentosiformis TaxID=4098 RepID=UPI00051BE66C|nr:transcription initiation factor TFIID subunit 8-like [Nicotiana tomentosiformis]XP_033516288.1 transcription initiation factor TFIID subunit 8-like [Nicotiana tomentosiformis]